MNVLLVLLPLGLGLLAIALAAFLWAVRHGQLENLDQEGMRILFDDDTPPPPVEGSGERAVPDTETHDASGANGGGA